MNCRATTIHAPWRFEAFRVLPRGCAARRTAAERLRRLNAVRRASAADKRRAEEWRRLVAASVWACPRAVGCVETGNLYRSPADAARKLKRTDRGAQAIRSANDGRPVYGGLRFVWLSGPRWTAASVGLPVRIGRVRLLNSTEMSIDRSERAAVA